MAARRRATVTRAPGSGIVLVQPPAAPLARARRRSSGGGRRRRGKGRRGGKGHNVSLQKRMIGVGIGGLAYGLLVKNFPQLPRLPGIGRSGTVALGIYLLKPNNEILRDMGIAAAAIAGYSFGETGSISGDDELSSEDY